jgi:Cysteine-rich CWC
MSALAEPIAAASVCPLCQRPNGCAMALGSAGATMPCWCVVAALDPGALARASTADGGAACVCAACAAGTP